MASNYPGSLDSFDTIASDKKTSDAVGGRTHRQMHNDLGDAIEAVQGELGTNPSGSYDTVKARIEAIEGSTLPQIDAKGDLIVGTADNTYDNLGVGTNDTVLLAASGETKGVKWAQVPTAAIQDGAVTAAKLATTGRFLFPTGAANGYGFASGAVHLSGTGSPEGVVTAAPGSTWLQTDATTDVKGWLRWIKATGTGNTGWVAGPESDTGLRALGSSLINGWTTDHANRVLLRRIGNTVTLTARNLVGTGASSAQLYVLPAGFRPRGGSSAYSPKFWAEMSNGGTADSVSVSGATGSISVTGARASYTDGSFSATWTTPDAWPSSLPGSAA